MNTINILIHAKQYMTGEWY